MKYLKKFEGNNQLYMPISCDDYQDSVFKRDLDKLGIPVSSIKFDLYPDTLKIFSKIDVIKFNQRDKELLIRYGFEFFPEIKNKRNDMNQLGPYFWKSELIASAIKKDSDTAILDTISSNGGFTIVNKTLDSWFYVHSKVYRSSRRNPGYIDSYYKCDDVEGLKEFLEENL